MIVGQDLMFISVAIKDPTIEVYWRCLADFLAGRTAKAYWCYWAGFTPELRILGHKHLGGVTVQYKAFSFKIILCSTNQFLYSQ